jgi:hypothetical protein
VNFNAVLSKK